MNLPKKVDEDIRAWCCEMINAGVPNKVISERAYYKGKRWCDAVTTSYLEHLKYGRVIDGKKYSDEAVDFSFEDGKLCYVFNDRYLKYPVLRQREPLKEIARMFFDKMGAFRNIITEGELVSICAWVRNGVYEAPSQNTFLRDIRMPENQIVELRKIAFRK